MGQKLALKSVLAVSGTVAMLFAFACSSDKKSTPGADGGAATPALGGTVAPTGTGTGRTAGAGAKPGTGGTAPAARARTAATAARCRSRPVPASRA